MSNITYHSLSDYVGGSCITKTFALDGVSYADHLTAISDWLESITARLNDGELREEWIVCDYENVPSNYVGEYSIDESFFDLMETISNSHLDAEVFNAGVACGIGIDQIEDSYKGQFSNDLEFGQYDFDELYLHEIPDHLVWYIDYEHYAREVMFDHSSESGHYFRNL